MQQSTTTMAAALRRVGLFATYERPVRWPHKRFNKTVGIQRDVKTGDKIGKVN